MQRHLENKPEWSFTWENERRKKMVKITEYETHNVVIMYCPECGVIEGVKTNDAKFAYLEINRFRKEHEHLEKGKE